jgi:hypothetical protein
MSLITIFAHITTVEKQDCGSLELGRNRGSVNVIVPMFTCENCRKQKDDNERSSVDLLTRIGFLVALRFLWSPSYVCKDCIAQVRSFGIALFVLVIVVGLIFMAAYR